MSCTRYFYDKSDPDSGVVSASRQRNGRMPIVNLSMPDRAIGSSKIYVGGAAQAAYLLDHQNLDDPLTKQNLFRFDGGPTLRAPLSTLSFLSATADASWRITHWSKSYVITNLADPTEDRLQVPIGLTRQLFEVEASMTGPVVARIFPARGLKHVIEPRFSIGRTSSFADRIRVVEIDSVDTLVGGTTTVNYGLINRLLVRGAPSEPGRRGQVREVLSVAITQSVLHGTPGLHLRPRLLEQPRRHGGKFLAAEHSRLGPRERQFVRRLPDGHRREAPGDSDDERYVENVLADNGSER